MRSTLLVLASFLSLKVGAITPPDQNTVDRYVQIAINTDAETLQGNGNVRCTYPMLINDFAQDTFENEAFGDNQNEASNNLALLCIKDRCNQVGAWTNAGIDNLNSNPIEATAEYLGTLGFSPEEVRQLLGARQNMNREEIQSTTCATGTALQRMMMFDSCFANVMTCGRR